mgnify:CR=1 FL=1
MSHKDYGQKGIANDVEYGKGGPRLVVDTGVIKSTQNDGSTLEEFKGATPTSADSFATKEYVDTRAGAPVTGQINGGSPPAVVNGALYICTTTGGAYTEKNLYYGKGGSWVEKVPVEGQSIHVTDALSGGNQEYEADHIYVYDADNTEWDDIGPAAAATKIVKSERLAFDYTDTGANNVGSSLPANAKVRGVKLNVTQIFDGTTPVVKVGDSVDDDRHMTEAENDLETVGVYQTEVAHLYGSSTQVVATVTIGGSPSQGTAELEVEYSIA